MIDGLRRHNYENFWEINQALCDKHVTELKKYAIRVFSNVHHTYVQPNIEVSRPPGEQDEEGTPTAATSPNTITLGDVLLEAFPRLFESVLSDSGDIEL